MLVFSPKKKNAKVSEQVVVPEVLCDHSSLCFLFIRIISPLTQHDDTAEAPGWTFPAVAFMFADVFQHF